MRYFKGVDWTIIQDLRLRYFHKNGFMKNFILDERIITYYDDIDDNSHILGKTLSIILNEDL